MPLPDRQRRALTRRHQTFLDRLGLRAGVLLASVWDGLDGYDEADVDDFEARSRPPLAAAKRVAVASSVAYFSTLAQIRPAAIEPGDVPVPVETREPFIAYWAALKNGHPVEAALESGRGRAAAIAANFVVSAARRTGDHATASAEVDVIGFERVANRGACTWCRARSGTVYDTAEAADYGHDRCHCSAAPVFA
jgi:hypothetical protein